MPAKKDTKPAEACLDPEPGADCLYYHAEQHAWAPGQVTGWDGKAATVQTQANTNPLFTWETGQVVTGLKAHEVYMANKEVLSEDVQDLLNLTVLHDSTLLNVLRRRYFNDLIYTNIGAITVALNPFNFKIPWYTDDNMPKYLAEGDTIEKNIPHSWASAHNTYFEMRNAVCEPYNQCILVSGESGAGKTEASKIVMKYLAAISCKQGTQEQKEAALAVGTKINITSPPLEAFGNAKTVRNDNSSRFGKWMKVQFDDSGFLVGAHITKYLLEKSRIVTAQINERVYHSFYILCRANERSTWGVTTDTDYTSTTAGKISNNKEFDTAEEFAEVWSSFKQLNVPDDTLDAIWRVCAGILNLENVDFEADGEGSKLKGNSQAWVDKFVSNWLLPDGKLFSDELVTTTIETRDGPVTKLLNTSKAKDGRSALTKTVYDSEFAWIINQCNEMLNVGGGARWIGLLDIFGFEDFEVNSFEQLCINLANESLQNHYNKYIFERDMDECRAEGIDVTAVEFPDNGPCLRMITTKGGIFSLLDEECALGQGSDDGFLAKVADYCSGVKDYEQFFTKPRLAKSSFIIHHYAGSVSYEIEGFLDKNRDTLKPAYKLITRSSQSPYIASLLPEPDENAKKITVGGFFKSQVGDLMDLINSTNPHWIRCVKPHPAKKPLTFHGVNTMAQLASSGVLGTVKIRKAGFPVRIPFDAFSEKYNIISSSGSDPASIIAASGIDPKQAQVGKTRVFLKSDAYVEMEKCKKACLEKYNATVLAYARAYLATIRIKGLVMEKVGGVVENMRKEVREKLKAERERIQREAKEKAEAEAKAKAEAAEAERKAMEAMKDALEHIHVDCEDAGKKIVADEDKAWRTMMEDFEMTKEAIVEETKEREERERTAREAKIAREIAMRDDAAIMIQKNIRGWLCRCRLLREFCERSRAATEFELDARMFHQRMIMMNMDKARVQMEQDSMKAARQRHNAEERAALWKANEDRRAAQLKAVADRKMERYLDDQRRDEEVTEQAMQQAYKLRLARQEKEANDKRARREANKEKRERFNAIMQENHEKRERRQAETAEYLARRQQRDALTEQSHESVSKNARLTLAQQQARAARYDRGRNAYREKEEIEREIEDSQIQAAGHSVYNSPHDLMTHSRTQYH